MNRERWSFSSKNNDKMIFYVAWNNMFTDYWKVLVLNFSELGNSSFFDSESWGKDGIYWLLKSPLFELFEDWKYRYFLSQKVDKKMIFTWCSWAFHDIPWLGEYGFLCSEYLNWSKPQKLRLLWYFIYILLTVLFHRPSFSLDYCFFNSCSYCTNFNYIAKLVIPIGTAIKEAKAKIEMHPVIVEAKIRKCSI